MKIVAFLQNMWVRNPDKVRAQIARDPTGKLRQRLIAYSLFAGCLTGRRLRAALGPDLCDQIIWEEASPVIADNPRDYHPPDEAHIARVLAHYGPDLVLCFSRRAEPTIRALYRGRVIFGPHPAARGSSTMQELRDVRTMIIAANLQLSSPAA